MNEPIDRTEAERIVSTIFTGILRRPAGEAELKSYSDMLLSGFGVSRILDLFVTCDEFKQLTEVKLFAPPGHFYSPIVFPPEAERHMAALRARPTSEIPDVAIDHDRMVALWGQMAPLIAEFPFPDHAAPSFRYVCINQNYGFGDSSVLYAMLRLKRPKRLIEIGSGWSSACSLDTVDKYLGGDVAMTFIEPYPQLLRDIIGTAASRVEILEMPVQQAPIEVFETLEAGDVLFIDSTHVMRTGSDVCFELFEILPRLKKGVVVHIHDMFWPFEYPEHWVLQDNRSWNELYAVRALLMGSTDWTVIFFNDYFAKLEPDLVRRTSPRMLNNHGGGLWLERT